MGCGCLAALIAWFSPRLALFLLWLFTERLAERLDSFLMGFLGFLIAPYTTLFFVIVAAPGGEVSTLGWVFVAAGVLLDLGSWFGSGSEARRRSSESRRSSR